MEDTLSAHRNPHLPHSFSLPQEELMTISRNLPYPLFLDMETQMGGL